MSKLITVFGATGNQGGSVVTYILSHPTLSKEYKVRGITRNASKPDAKALAAKGVEIRSADLDDYSSVEKALEGSHTVFLVTNYWANPSPTIELSQGRNVLRASLAAGVQHLIFSSLVDVTEATHGRLKNVPHFDAKAQIEREVRSSGIGCSFVLPGYFMGNFKATFRKGEDGSYSLAMPVSEEAKFPLLDPGADMGKFVGAALRHFGSASTFLPHGTRIYAATDYYPLSRIIAEFEDVTGKKVHFTKLEPEQYKAFLPAAVAQEFLENHLFIESPGYYDGADLRESLALLDKGDKLTTWKEWVKRSGFV